jgi:transcription antitermination protein NusB
VRARRDARVLALLVLYETDTAQHLAGDVLQRHLNERAEIDTEIRDYTTRLVSGVVTRLDELNAILAECAPEFPVEQIAPIDRNILRIALLEIRASLAPPRAAINEAIEIAKEFGSESTPRFVNGVLGAAMARMPAPSRASASSPGDADDGAGGTAGNNSESGTGSRRSK